MRTREDDEEAREKSSHLYTRSGDGVDLDRLFVTHRSDLLHPRSFSLIQVTDIPSSSESPSQCVISLLAGSYKRGMTTSSNSTASWVAVMVIAKVSECQD